MAEKDETCVKKVVVYRTTGGAIAHAVGKVLCGLMLLFALFSCVGEPDLLDAVVARVGGDPLAKVEGRR